jgi:hypothetical protein
MLVSVLEQQIASQSIPAEIVVIIPFRGELQELKEAVNSVRASTFTNFRLLVIDDRPGENVIPDFLKREEYIASDGQGLPRVIELSKKYVFEKFVVLLAGDDLMSSRRLLLQYEAIKQLNAEVCLSGMRKFSSRKAQIEMLTGNPRIKTFTKLWLLLGAYGADGTIFMTSEFFREKYILDAEDSYSDWTIALENYPSKVAYVPQDLVFYRQHANQTTRNGRNDFLTSGVFPAWSKVYENFFRCTPSIQVFQILAAPWFRSKTSPVDILKSRFYAKQILASFILGNFTPEEIESAESLVIRRYLFRLRPVNLIPILSVLLTLGVRHPIRRIAIEIFEILRELIRQYGVKPRTVGL